MKFKVRGLVFVGFAAAILSANAMAANEAQTVTSKAFTEATYQKKVGGGANANKLVQATDTAGTVSYVEIGNAKEDIAVSSNKVVTGNAVAAALEENGGQVNNGELSITVNNTTRTFTANQSGDTTFSITGLEETANKTQSITSASTTTEYPSAKAVYDALNGAQHANFQTYSETANQISDGNGGWKALDPVIDGTTASSVAAPTTAAVKTYVDNKATAAASDILADTPDATDDDHALTNAATTTALNGKQSLQSGDTYQVSKNGSWTAANGAVSAGAHIAKTDNADGSVTVAVDDITSAATDIDNTDTGLTTGAAVYDFVTGKIKDATGGNTIPEKNPAICDATGYAPCALVAESDGLHWYTIATADHAGGVLGDAPATPANP